MTGPRAKSRRLEKPNNLAISESDKSLVYNYCRRCKRNLPAKMFLSAVDLMIDTNGLFSICTDCCENLFQHYFQSEQNNQKAMKKLCRQINLRFDAEAVQFVEREIETRIKNGTRANSTFFGFYRKQLTRIGQTAGEDLTFIEASVYFTGQELDPKVFAEETINHLESFWGKGMTPEDYQFLEEKLTEWKKSYSCKTKGEELYIKEACFKELDLKKARTEGKSTDSILKSMNDLLKNAALTPAQANVASSNNADTIGLMIKRIEQTSPAEYYKDKDLFANFDHLETYFTNYVKRPTQNTLSGTKDFELVDDDSFEISSEESEK
jgi:hypothetical protein